MWPPARRRDYLLREDIVQPLSADRHVWPLREPHAEYLPWEPPETIPVPAEGELVVLGIAPEDAEEEEEAARMHGTSGELEPGATWEFLGHDVADSGETPSGLCNCGYDEGASKEALRAVWASRLNAHGLFDDLGDAFAFRTTTRDRVPEHHPFRVVGLWAVRRARNAA